MVTKDPNDSLTSRAKDTPEVKETRAKSTPKNIKPIDPKIQSKMIEMLTAKAKKINLPVDKSTLDIG